MAAINRRRRLLLLLVIIRRIRSQNESKRRFWVREVFKERSAKGEYNLLVKELMLVDHELFFKMFRMMPTKFEELLSWVAPLISRSAIRRKPIPPGERLSVTLRYLVSGDSFVTIASSYRMSDTTVGRIVKETCNVLWDVLIAKGFISSPDSSIGWKKTSEVFEQQWNFPNCVGAIDGKHVIIQCPPRGGSMYFNYKKFHSVVLMAVGNGNYEFILVDIGDYGRLSDGGVFSSSHLGHAINTESLNLPPPRQLIANKLFPYVFVGDAAFPLRSNLVKPYPGTNLPEEERIANYRISRARRIIENVFGIATSRFRVFRRPICANVDTAIAVTKAVVALHNYLMRDRSNDTRNKYCPSSFVDCDEGGTVLEGDWRNDTQDQALLNVSNTGSNNHSQLAKKVRDNFRDFFCSEQGAVPWQQSMVTRTNNLFDM